MEPARSSPPQYLARTRPATDAPPSSFLPLSRPDIGIAEVEEMLDSIRSGWLTTGPKVELFEQRLAGYIGVPHVRCLSSCTAGLFLALKVSGVGPGDEVLVPTMTFVSCANVVEQLGGRPVFVDCDPETGLMDLDAAERAAGPDTKALIVVHLAGRPLDMHRVNRIRDRRGLAVVEDAAHAIGAEWDGRRIGAHGNLTSFSFHATKNITTFEGGALVVPDEAMSDRVRQLSLHGLSRSSWSRRGAPGADAYDVVEPGFKLGMHDVAAAVGIHQLERLDGWIERRAELALQYDQRLADLPVSPAPALPGGARHAHHVYAVRLADSDRRNAVIEGLRVRGLGTSVHFRPIHTFTYYADRYGHRPQDLPQATALSASLISLPLFPRMTEDDVDRVVAALTELVS